MEGRIIFACIVFAFSARAEAAIYYVDKTFHNASEGYDVTAKGTIGGENGFDIKLTKVGSGESYRVTYNHDADFPNFNEHGLRSDASKLYLVYENAFAFLDLDQNVHYELSRGPESYGFGGSVSFVSGGKTISGDFSYTLEPGRDTVIGITPIPGAVVLFVPAIGMLGVLWRRQTTI